MLAPKFLVSVLKLAELFSFKCESVSLKTRCWRKPKINWVWDHRPLSQKDTMQTGIGYIYIPSNLLKFNSE